MSFTCPRCGRTSHHPVDEAEGYCGACHEWTGRAGTDHQHRFSPQRRRVGTIVWCLEPGCGSMRVWGRLTHRPLNYTETINVIAHMLEATAIGQAMQIIHGRERGLRRAREVLGYE